MIGIEIERQDPFREQSAPNYLKPRGRKPIPHIKVSCPHMSHMSFCDASSVQCALVSIRHRTNLRISTPVEQSLEPTLRPRVKICCISNVAEAKLALRYGADALGLVARMPSGPGVISESTISEIAAIIPPSVGSFLLTSELKVADIVPQQQRCRVNTLQIVDRLEQGRYEDLRAALPGVSLVQVIHVTGEESIHEACHIAEQGVDALLLDSGDQRLPVKVLGGNCHRGRSTFRRGCLLKPSNEFAA
jgi:phosphoribosylanthranilate isomerase